MLVAELCPCSYDRLPVLARAWAMAPALALALAQSKREPPALVLAVTVAGAGAGAVSGADAGPECVPELVPATGCYQHNAALWQPQRPVRVGGIHEFPTR